MNVNPLEKPFNVHVASTFDAPVYKVFHARTEPSVSHTDLPDDAMQRRHTKGWAHFLGVLSDRFDAGAR